MSDIPVDPREQSENLPVSGDAHINGSSKEDVSQAAGPQAGSSDLQGEVDQAEPPETTGDAMTARIEQTGASVRSAESVLEQGGVHRGKVTRVTCEEVFVNLGGALEGIVPIMEFAAQPIPQDGEEISVIVDRLDPERGLLVLSKQQADEYTFWQAVQPGDTLEGVVTGMNKGGLDVDLGGARAFLPASHVDVRRMRDISMLIGEHVRCVVTQVDRTTHDLVVSRKKYIERERRRQRQEILNHLTEGEIRNGTVSNVTDFGAFIDLGGADGLLHLTDMSWSRVRHPKEVVEEGQQIEVRVLKVDRKAGKISLGLKQIKPDPWDGVETRYPAGARVRGRVVRTADFGVFLELEEGVDALLPISELSWSRRINHPSELLRVGDTPEVVVLKVDPGKRRIAVGLKQTEENPWLAVETRFPANSWVKGRVSKVADFGAFVELIPGVEGLVHISELSDKHVRAVSDVVEEGQQIDVRVIKADAEAQRISLSMKPEPKEPPVASGDGGADKAKKKRKRPLRGGLASHFDW